LQSLTKTNVLFRFKKGWPQLFLNWVSCWKLTRKNVLCWGNCCQFGEQFLTDRIFWATFPKHSQNRCFIPSLHKITTVSRTQWGDQARRFTEAVGAAGTRGVRWFTEARRGGPDRELRGGFLAENSLKSQPCFPIFRS